MVEEEHLELPGDRHHADEDRCELVVVVVAVLKEREEQRPPLALAAVEDRYEVVLLGDRRHGEGEVPLLLLQVDLPVKVHLQRLLLELGVAS